MKNNLLMTTNGIWNECAFNSQYNLGGIMAIARRVKPVDAHDLSIKYMQSGEQLKSLIQEFPEQTQKLLNDPIKMRDYALAINKKDRYKIMAYQDMMPAEDIQEIKQWLRMYGRSKEYLQGVVKDFSATAIDNHCYLVSDEEARLQVFHRLFEETYRGYRQEESSKQRLKDLFTSLNFEDAPDKFDGAYAVDLLGRKNGELVVGVQVKPTTYLASKSASAKYTHEMNTKKNQQFQDKFKVPVIYFYYANDNDFMSANDWRTMSAI